MATIGQSIVFKGELTGDEDLEIDGQVEGNVRLANNQLTIGSSGRVTAQVVAKSIIVIGRVKGNLTATERIEIQATGIVEGDVKAPRLNVQEGAVVNGGIDMSASASTTAQASASTPQPAREEAKKPAASFAAAPAAPAPERGPDVRHLDPGPMSPGRRDERPACTARPGVRVSGPGPSRRAGPLGAGPLHPHLRGAAGRRAWASCRRSAARGRAGSARR